MKLKDVFIDIQSRTQEIEIIPLGDIHDCARNSATKQLKKTVAYIRDNPNTRWFGGGDIVDCIKPSDVKRNDFTNFADWLFLGKPCTIRERLKDIVGQSVEHITDILDPIKDKCLGLIEGNHEYTIRQYHNEDVQSKLCKKLGVDNLTDAVLFRVKFKRQGSQGATVFLAAWHGWGGGRSEGAEPNKLAQMRQVWQNADICLRGHCFSEDTELLTVSGWKKYTDIRVADEIYNFDMLADCIYKDRINKVFIYDNYTQLVNIKNEHTDLLITDEHQIIYKYTTNRKGKCYNHKWIKRPINFFDNKSFQVKIPCSSVLQREDYPMPDCWVKLLGLLISEGHFRVNRYGKPSGLQLYQRSGNEKYMRDTIDQCCLKYTEYNKKDKGKISVIRGKPYETHNNTIVFYVHEESAKEIRSIISSKQIPPCVYEFSERQFDMFMEAMIYGDGSIKGNKAYAYYSKDCGLLDDLQRLAPLFGYRTILNPHRDSFDLVISKRTTTTIMPPNISKKSYSGKVWCVNTGNGTVIVRRNGRVSIVGNSHILDIRPPQVSLYLPAEGELPTELYQKSRWSANWGCWLKSYAAGESTYDSRANYPARPLGTIKVVIQPFSPIGERTTPKIKLDYLIDGE